VPAPKVIKLYIGRDERSAELFRNLSNIIRQIPVENRPKLKVRVVKIKNPDEFPSFLEQLEEIFGGLYTLEFRKYQITKLPAIIIDEEKVLEGSYPTNEELLQILAYEGIVVKEEPALAEKAVQVYPRPKVTREIREEARAEPKIEGEAYTTEPYKLIEVQEVSDVIKEKEEVVTPRKIEKAAKEKPVVPEIETQIQEMEVQRPEPATAGITTEEKTEVSKSIKGTCYDCIFFDESRNRCTLYHVNVSNPYKPACGRGLRKT